MQVNQPKDLEEQLAFFLPDSSVTSAVTNEAVNPLSSDSSQACDQVDPEAKDVIRQEMERLAAQIQQWRYQYNVKNESEVEDSVYDAVYHHLIDLERAYPDLADPNSPTQQVGGVADSQFASVPHEVPMQSIQDVFSFQEVEDAMQRMRLNLQSAEITWVLEQKIDGLSISLEYEEGKLIRASTRGDGWVGEDVTANVRALRSVPEQLQGDYPPWLEVRGEIYLTHAQFEAIKDQLIEERRAAIEEQNRKKIAKRAETQAKNPNKTYPPLTLKPFDVQAEIDAGRIRFFKNPRNAASGALRQLDPTITGRRNLSLFIFNIQSIRGKRLTSHQEGQDCLVRWGLPVVPSSPPLKTVESVKAAIDELGEKRPTLGYDIDGAVLKIDSLAQREALGITSAFPLWAVAYKYPPLPVETVLESIEVTVGRTGRLTPLAHFQPVQVQGSQIAKATLHNEDYIRTRDIRIGDTIRIIKAGDVIPAVVDRVLEKRPSHTIPWQMPTVCPACSEPVHREPEEAEWYCVSPDCPAQRQRHLEHFVSKSGLDLQGIGPSILQKLGELSRVESIVDLFRLAPEDLEGAVDSARIPALMGEIQAAKTAPLSRYLQAFGIPLVGGVAAKALALRFADFAALELAEREDFLAIDGIGPRMADSLYTFFHSTQTQQWLRKLETLGVSPRSEVPDEEMLEQQASLPWAGKSFALTGTIPGMKRAVLQETILALGGQVEGGVTRKTTTLIQGEEKGGGKSRKTEQAETLGIEIWSGQDFLLALDQARESLQ